jgi:hypothetical protein
MAGTMADDSKLQAPLSDREKVLMDEIALLKKSYSIPVRRLMAIDDLLFTGCLDDADAMEKRTLAGARLTGAGSFQYVSNLCASNDLMMAAWRFAQMTMEADSSSRSSVRLSASLANALGEFEQAWDLLEQAGDTQRFGASLVHLALLTGHVGVAQSGVANGAPDDVARFTPLVNEALRQAAVPRSQTAQIPVFIVNVPTDRYRRKRAASYMALLGLEPFFRHGYKPSEIPTESLKLFKRSLNSVSDGTFGNQYAQYEIWREIAEQNIKMGLIVEDDAILAVNPGELMNSLELPSDWDIIFANDRLDMTLIEPSSQKFQLDPFEPAFALHSRVTPDKVGYGSDCYFVSQQGAAKLVEIARTQGFRHPGTDWWIQSHCMVRNNFGAFNEASHLVKEIGRHHKLNDFSPVKLNGYILSPSIARTRSIGTSRRQRV